MKSSQLWRGRESCRTLLLPDPAGSGLPLRAGVPTAGVGYASSRSPLELDARGGLGPECVTVLMWHP